MRLSILGGLLAAAVATSGSAMADPTPTGVEIGLRSGYSLPLGGVSGDTTTNSGGASVTTKGQNLSDVFSGRVPIWVDAGYRFTPNIYVGAFFQFGIIFPVSNTTTGCGQNGVSCSANDLQFGVDAHYHLMPDQTIDPWVGVGVGYESVNTSTSGSNGQSLSGGLTGWQFVNLQVGGDYKVMPNLGVGPFVAFSLGQYSSASASSGGSSISSDIQNKALHEWLTFGVRGVYDINL